MVATVVVRVAATDHATGCLMALGTAVEEVAAVKAAGDRDGGTLTRSERGTNLRLGFTGLALREQHSAVYYSRALARALVTPTLRFRLIRRDEC
jgi:hypothetical protein